MSATAWIILILVFAGVGYGVYWASKKTLEEKPEKPQRIEKATKKKGK